MTYDQALAYLHGTARFGSKPGLSRVAALLRRLGDPQKHLRSVHIAGTNGKGSVAAMTERILRQAGYSTGLCISPYLLDFCERIQCNGVPIDRNELARYVAELKTVVESMTAQGLEHPTEFELVVALTLRVFADRKVDFCVVEVGLGGRWDATNVIEAPLVAAITSISFDHMEYLGDTLRQITMEKCGIFKNGALAVAGGIQREGVCDEIERHAAEKGLPLTFTDPAALTVLQADRRGAAFRYKDSNYTIHLAGRHQIHNAMVAIEIACALRRRGISIPNAAVAEGLAQTQWAGRLQTVGSNPAVVLDVAHNADGMQALCQSLDTLYRDKEIFAAVAMCGDKQADRCLAMLAKRLAHCYTAAADTVRALPAQAMRELALPYCPATACASVTEAVTAAIQAAGPNGIALICGTFYMMPEAWEIVNNR